MPGYRAVQRSRAADGQGQPFDPNGLQRRVPGQAGCQYFFTEQSRPMCLYVVLGSARRRGTARQSQANQVLDGDQGGRRMTMTLPERLVQSISSRSRRRKADTGTSRRGFLGGAAMVGAAMAVDPWGYLVRPAGAYATVCGTDAACADGYSVFCCTINGGRTACPPNSFIGGWWKADNSSFCGGSARYYIDCNAFRDGAWQCRCAEGTCDQRRVACNQFRYGQCSLEIPASTPDRSSAGWCPARRRGSSSAAPAPVPVRRTTARRRTSAPCVGGKSPVGSVDVVAGERRRHPGRRLGFRPRPSRRPPSRLR